MVEDKTTGSPSLNAKNYLNVISYIINTVITFGVGQFGWFGAQSNGDLSDKYQTLITPKGSAFSIWGVIFTFQAIFTVYQLLPGVRSKPMVQEGVGYWYVGTCLFQAGWTFAFGFEQITAALVLIILIWLSLVGLVYQQFYVKNADKTLMEFWFLRFPFAIHCGWLTAASVLNVNVLAVKLDFDETVEVDSSVQLAMGIVSLAYLHAVSVWVLYGFSPPNYTIAGVLAWATGWIYAELLEPREAIETLFGTTIVTAVSFASLAVCCIISGQIVLRVILLFVPSCAVNQSTLKNDEDTVKDEEHAANSSMNDKIIPDEENST